MLERVLRELVKKRGLRQTARDLGVDSGNLYRSLMDGSNLKLNRIEAILELFGYELKISKRKGVNAKPLSGQWPRRMLRRIKGGKKYGKRDLQKR
jgi:hypothetical protein